MRPGRLSSESQGEARSERRIFAVLTQFAAMRLVLASAGLVRNKVVAFKLGPAAFGEITQIAAATAVASAVVCFGMGVSLSRNSARATSPGERQDLLANANGIVLCLAGAGVSVAVGLHLAGHLLPLIGIAQTPATVFAGIVFIDAVPVDALSGNYLALLQGILDVRALAIRRGLRVLPILFGGKHERNRRAGTENVAGIVGFGVAAGLARAKDEGARLSQLRDRLEEGILRAVPGTQVNGARTARVPNTTNISFDRTEAESLLIALDLEGVAVSTGSACSSGTLEPSHVLKAMGLPAHRTQNSIRFSLGAANTEEEIDRVVAILPGLVDKLRSLTRVPVRA